VFIEQEKVEHTLTQMNYTQVSPNLAHNVVVWAKRWLSQDAPKLRKYGVQRIVRDVLAVSGFLELGKGATIKRMVLNSASALGRACAKAL
jgi:hypothetical protein